MPGTRYRIYADGSVVDETLFAELDHAQPYYDDYVEIEIPDVVIDYIAGD